MTQSSYELLTLIDDWTKWEGDQRPGQKLTCYFVPKAEPQWSATLRKYINVHGPGVASTILGFMRKDWVRHHGYSKYACEITEHGMLALEHYRELNIYVDGRFPQ